MITFKESNVITVSAMTNVLNDVAIKGWSQRMTSLPYNTGIRAPMLICIDGITDIQYLTLRSLETSCNL